MGSIWEAYDTRTRVRVALKLIEPMVDNADVQERFVTEARVGALLQSENVVRIHDHGKTGDGVQYMVMELLAGETLEERLARVGRLSLIDTASILGQVCAALQQAHDLGIVHRDIKPENVFITERGVAKLIDFGLAKVRHPDAAPLSGTRTGTILGTPLYMSPEQGRALKSVDHRTDVWSLGVVAFRCVTGRVPFEASSFADLLVRASTGDIPKASSLQMGVPTLFDGWVALALHPDPAQRFATVTALSRALTRVAQEAARSGAAATQPCAANPVLGPLYPHLAIPIGLDQHYLYRGSVARMRPVSKIATLLPLLLASTAAAQDAAPPPPPPPPVVQPPPPPPATPPPARDGVRFRGGISLAGGGEFGGGFGFGLGGLDGRLGVQFNNLIGLYAQPHLSFGAGSVSGVSGATGTFAATALIDFTFIDRIFVAAGGGYGLANNPSGPAIHFRLGAYPLVGRSDLSIVRKGLMVGVDTRVMFVSAGGSGITVVQIMGAVGYEAF